MTSALSLTNTSLSLLAQFADNYNDTANAINASQAISEIRAAVANAKDIQFNIKTTINTS
jgi:hypothetical protein